MKKVILSLLLIVSISISSRAQYVSIPDSNFGNWLNSNGYSACLRGNGTTGWQMDTTCSAVVNATSIVCSSANIFDITGITFFRNLTTLSLSYNSVTSLPRLPSTLTELNCESNTLTSLPSLPVGLSTLSCSYNMLVTLPSLPTTLSTLYCDNNQLTALPVLPALLTTFNCSHNSLVTLPSLPSGLNELFCEVNRLTSLPSLPAGLGSMSCGYNQLSSLPSLPATLNQLYCSFNHLSSLPSLPAGVLYLDCSNNQLTSLPSLPAALGNLYCRSNTLSSLPSLPAVLGDLICDSNLLTTIPSLPAGLSILVCNSNTLSSLPNLPGHLLSLDCSNNPTLSCFPHIDTNRLTYFYIAGTDIHCIPNRFTASNFDIDPSSLPLCTAGSGCDFYYNIVGNIHNDTAATCIVDSLHPGTNVRNMKVQLKRNGNVLQQFYTFSSGEYSFKSDSLTSYDVSIDTTGVPVMVTCPTLGSRHLSLSMTDSVKVNQNFGVQCRGVDNGVFSITGSFRTALRSSVHISASDMAQVYGLSCAAHSTGTVTTTIIGSAHYISPAPGARTPTVSGRSLIYTITDFDSIRAGDFDLIVQTDSSAGIGSSICISTSVHTNGGIDVNHANDSLTQCFAVSNAIDPNEKTVSPIGVIDPSSQWLTYTVNFQNTGNDTAYTVVVKDTLSQYVDATSFQYLASSHRAVIQLFGSSMIFTFPKIDLLDSLHNEPLSHGWIQYKVKTKAGLPIGTQIKNTAFIYFDINPAVVTNTVANTVLTCATSYDTISRSICASDSFAFGANYYHTAGYYTQTLSGASASGCDSIITLILAVNQLPIVSWTQTDTFFCEDYNPPAWPLTGFSPLGGTFSGATVMNDTLYPSINTYHISYSYSDSNHCSNSVTKTFEFKICLGVSDVSGTQLMRVYPNPSNGSFTLETSDMIGQEYMIYDMLGQIIQQRTITTDRQQIDIGQVSTGIYTLMIKGKSGATRIVLK